MAATLRELVAENDRLKQTLAAVTSSGPGSLLATGAAAPSAAAAQTPPGAPTPATTADGLLQLQRMHTSTIGAMQDRLEGLRQSLELVRQGQSQLRLTPEPATPQAMHMPSPAHAAMSASLLGNGHGSCISLVWMGSQRTGSTVYLY